MKERNIQSLFLSIRMDQIRTYLLERGWKERLTSVRREFEKADADSDGMRTLILPLEESHPRYRSLVPNVVFSLAVESQREAIDIAEEISKVDVSETTSEAKPAPQSASSTTSVNPCRIEIGNCGAKPIALTLSTLGSPLQIPPAESLLLSLVANEGVIQVSADCDVAFTLPSDCESRIYFGFPQNDFSFESATQLGDQLYAASSNWEQGDGTGTPGLRQSIFSAANRFLYEVEIPHTRSGKISTAEMKSVTGLLVSLSRLMRADRESALDLFFIARCLLKPFGVTISHSITLPDQFWVTFRSDDLDAPRNSVELLKSTTTVSAGSSVT